MWQEIRVVQKRTEMKETPGYTLTGDCPDVACDNSIFAWIDLSGRCFGVLVTVGWRTSGQMISRWATIWTKEKHSTVYVIVADSRPSESSSH